MEIDPELKEALRIIVQEAVAAEFRDVGLDRSNPKEVFEVRRDLAFIREQRELCDGLRSKSVWWVLSTILVGGVALLVLGFRAYVSGQ